MLISGAFKTVFTKPPMGLESGESKLLILLITELSVVSHISLYTLGL